MNWREKMSNPVIGFIGCGEIAQLHAHCLKKIGAKIGGGYDLSSQALLNFTQKFGGEKYLTPGELLKDPAIDAVYICTRHDTHFMYIELAAYYQKPVFCEKPLAIDYKTAKRAYEVVVKHGIKCMIGFNHRFAPGIRALKEQLTLYERPFDVLNINFTSAPFLSSWAGKAEQGGGIFVCLGSHVFDLVHYLCESKITDIKVTALRQRLEEPYLEDTFGALLKTDKNQLITISTHDHGNSRFSVDPGNNLHVTQAFVEEAVLVATASSLTIYDNEVNRRTFETDMHTSWGYMEANRTFIDYLHGENVEIPDISEGLRTSEMVQRCRQMTLEGNYKER